jgi:hypothetical protein
MLPLSPPQTRPPSLAGKCSLLALLPLLATACASIEAEDFCYAHQGLQFNPLGELGENIDEEAYKVGYTDSRVEDIDISEAVLELIDLTDKWHPELSLKSIRLSSPNNGNLLFRKLRLSVKPTQGSSLPSVTVAEYDAPIVSWPANQTYIQAKPLNIFDYLSEEGIVQIQLDVATEPGVDILTLDIEICIDAKASGSLLSLL